MSKLQSLDTLATALATGSTVAEAAQRAGIAERTAYRRLKEPQTQQQIREVRAALLDRAVGKLADSMDAAVATLVRNLTAAPPSVQVRAAVALLEQGVKLRTSVELEQRVAAAETAVTQEEQQYAAA